MIETIEFDIRPHEFDDLSIPEVYALGFEFAQIYFALANEDNTFEHWKISLLNLRRAQKLAEDLNAKLWFRIVNDEEAEISNAEN